MKPFSSLFEASMPQVPACYEASPDLTAAFKDGYTYGFQLSLPIDAAEIGRKFSQDAVGAWMDGYEIGKQSSFDMKFQESTTERVVRFKDGMMNNSKVGDKEKFFMKREYQPYSDIQKRAFAKEVKAGYSGTVVVGAKTGSKMSVIHVKSKDHIFDDSVNESVNDEELKKYAKRREFLILRNNVSNKDFVWYKNHQQPISVGEIVEFYNIHTKKVEEFVIMKLDSSFIYLKPNNGNDVQKLKLVRKQL
jgi:hypothetical protein